jgi:hypothetical protein
VTSRGLLTGLAGARFVSLSGLADSDALALLSLNAGPARIAAEPAAAQAIVAACAGLPLALRLAGVTLAARPGLSMARLARELCSGRILDVLAAEDISVRAAISSSYRAVSSTARDALSTAAANIPGDIDAAELAMLAGGDGTVIGQLVTVGLLAAAQETGGTDERYTMHPLIRAFALDQTRQSADRRSAAVTRVPGFTQAS